MKKGFVALNDLGQFLNIVVIVNSGFTVNYKLRYSWVKEPGDATIFTTSDISRDRELLLNKVPKDAINHIKKEIIAMLPAVEHRTITLGELS